MQYGGAARFLSQGERPAPSETRDSPQLSHHGSYEERLSSEFGVDSGLWSQASKLGRTSPQLDSLNGADKSAPTAQSGPSSTDKPIQGNNTDLSSQGPDLALQEAQRPNTKNRVSDNGEHISTPLAIASCSYLPPRLRNSETPVESNRSRRPMIALLKLAQLLPPEQYFQKLKARRQRAEADLEHFCMSSAGDDQQSERRSEKLETLNQ
ncbi:hypothetical protein FALBO_922 [Fusarium albosuccineum]|uniref:Uncharacterized protein n=1 Tax=Fusarium albosuccineum TaxID=1237068 RepID=A0A8H4LPW2_9HYPO|nr:hypothetical protein FALBO_922 [Fusarium albosuccineum]